MKRLLPRIVCFSLGMALVALTATPAQAAARLVETLEWAVVDSDLVVQGTITEFDREIDNKRIIWSTGTVKIEKTFKGEAKKEIKFIASHRSRFASDQLATLGKNKAEVLLCLVKSERYKSRHKDYAEAPWALRIAVGEIEHAAVDLTGKTAPLVVSMDASLLAKKADILKAAGAVAAGEKPKQGQLLAPPSSDVVKKLTENDNVWLFVPLGAPMENHLKEWLKNKDNEVRLAGVKGLQQFKSEGNIGLLKGLLKDPQSKVRKAAYDVLKGWGVSVKAPGAEE